jgi:hypothetical protein
MEYRISMWPCLTTEPPLTFLFLICYSTYSTLSTRSLSDSSPVTTMLCRYCENIELADSSGRPCHYVHQPSWSLLVHSAKHGCQLCCLLEHEIRLEMNSHPGNRDPPSGPLVISSNGGTWNRPVSIGIASNVDEILTKDSISSSYYAKSIAVVEGMYFS